MSDPVPTGHATHPPHTPTHARWHTTTHGIRVDRTFKVSHRYLALILLRRRLACIEESAHNAKAPTPERAARERPAKYPTTSAWLA